MTRKPLSGELTVANHAHSLEVGMQESEVELD